MTMLSNLKFDHHYFRMPLAVLITLTVAVFAAADDNKNPPRGSKDRPDPNSLTIEEKARLDPEWYRRMLADLESFHSLPADQQERMRKLDKDLTGMDAATRKKLLRALDRYVNWLDHLTPQDRKYIENAPDSKDRLHRIREVRTKQWVQTQPKAIREEIMHASPKEREALIKKYRQEEKKRRQEWDAALKRGNPQPIKAGKASEEQQNKNKKD
jgi:hypothetical protein